MKLHSLRLTPRGDAGWDSGTLAFGQTTTLFLGPNGAGKTPLMKSIGFCLGHRLEVPALVQEKCASVVLTLGVGDDRIVVERFFEAGVKVVVTEPAGVRLEFDTDAAFSAWALPKLGVPLRTFLTANEKLTQPYVSFLGPIFFVDQDTGWSNTYAPLENVRFVKQQYEEVMRWVLDIPAKNRAVDKDEFQAAKDQHEIAQRLVAIRRGVVESLQRDLGEDGAADAVDRLRERSSQLDEQLTRARIAFEGVGDADSELEARVTAALQNRAPLSYRIENIRRRQAQLSDVRREVEAELGALEENEVAADAFRHFCGNENCAFFRKPEESYGRRVLYLKDQLKDFENANGEANREIELASQQLASAEEELKGAIAARNNRQSPDGAADLIELIRTGSQELSNVHTRLAQVNRLERERTALEELIASEQRAAELVDSLRPTAGPRRDNTRLVDARQALARHFREWLHALKTPNVSGDVVFDDNLQLIIDGERFAPQSGPSGSTRTRIVLAFHAAVLETSLDMNGKHPPLLVLDAPRQHELSAADLRSFVRRFYGIFSKPEKSAQLVFSATDPAVEPANCIDQLHKPTFDVGGGLHFLGPRPVSEKRTSQ